MFFLMISFSFPESGTSPSTTSFTFQSSMASFSCFSICKLALNFPSLSANGSKYLGLTSNWASYFTRQISCFYFFMSLPLTNQNKYRWKITCTYFVKSLRIYLLHRILLPLPKFQAMFQFFWIFPLNQSFGCKITCTYLVKS